MTGFISNFDGDGSLNLFPFLGYDFFLWLSNFKDCDEKCFNFSGGLCSFWRFSFFLIGGCCGNVFIFDADFASGCGHSSGDCAKDNFFCEWVFQLKFGRLSCCGD